MTKNIFEGKWKQFKGEVQSQWGNLTNDELDKIEGDRTKLEGLIQERYGLEKEEVQKKLDVLEKKYYV